MGFQTTVIILNDSLHMIREDKEFGEKLADAISQCNGRNDDMILVHAKDARGNVCGGAAQVVECHHANQSVLVMAGGNCGSVVAPYIPGWDHDAEKALKAFAEHLGFRVSKKSKRAK
jgi:hypothetical protein